MMVTAPIGMVNYYRTYSEPTENLLNLHPTHRHPHNTTHTGHQRSVHQNIHPHRTPPKRHMVSLPRQTDQTHTKHTHTDSLSTTHTKHHTDEGLHSHMDNCNNHPQTDICQGTQDTYTQDNCHANTKQIHSIHPTSTSQG